MIAKAVALEGKGLNYRTVRRTAEELSLVLLGVSTKELRNDPALRAYLRWKLYGESPEPWLMVGKSITKTLQTKTVRREPEPRKG